MQHDAHEFLNYLLNTIADILQGKSSRLITFSMKYLFLMKEYMNKGDTYLKKTNFILIFVI